MPAFAVEAVAHTVVAVASVEPAEPAPGAAAPAAEMVAQHLSPVSSADIRSRAMALTSIPF